MTFRTSAHACHIQIINNKLCARKHANQRYTNIECCLRIQLNCEQEENPCKMTSFKSLNTKKFAKTGQAVTADTLYWKRLNVSTNAHKSCFQPNLTSKLYSVVHRRLCWQKSSVESIILTSVPFSHTISPSHAPYAFKCTIRSQNWW